MEGGMEVLFEELAVFGDPAGDAFAPHAEAGGFEGAAHEVDDLFFGEAGAFLDFLEAGAVFPCAADDGREAVVGHGRWVHGKWRCERYGCRAGKERGKGRGIFEEPG